MTLVQKVTQLIPLLKDDHKSKYAYAKLKTLLLSKEKNFQKVKLHNAVRALREMFVSAEKKEVQEHLLSIIGILLTSKTYCEVFLRLHVLTKLKEVLKEKDSYTYCSTCQIVELLTEHPRSLKAIHTLDFVPILLQNLSSYDDSSESRRIVYTVRAISKSCRSSDDWMTVKNNNGFAIIAKAGVNNKDPKVVAVTMKSLKHFHRSNWDFYNQVMEGTNSFCHLKNLLATPDHHEQVRITAEDFVISILDMNVTKDSLKTFLKLFEAIESSMITNYLLKSMVDPKTADKRRDHLLSFFSRLVLTTWPLISQSKNKGCSMMSQIKTHDTLAYVNLYGAVKNDRHQRAQCLSLLSLYKRDDTMHWRAFFSHPDVPRDGSSNFIFQLSKVYDECMDFIGTLDCSTSGCHHLNLGGWSLPEEAIRSWTLRVMDDKQRADFRTYMTTIDLMWNIMSQAILSMGIFGYEFKHWIERLLLYYEKSPLVSDASQKLLIALDEVPRSFDCMIDKDIIGRLARLKTKNNDSCSFCWKTDHAATTFFNLLKNKYRHNRSVHQNLERLLQSPESNPKRNRVLFTFPLVISCCKCSMYYYRKFNVIPTLTQFLESPEEVVREQASTTLNIILRRIQMFARDSPHKFQSILDSDRYCKIRGCLWTNDPNKDLTINVGSSSFEVNREKLASASPVFSAMFLGSFLEGTSDTVTLTSFDDIIFRHIVHGVYGCFCETKRTTDGEDLVYLMQVSHMYALSDILEFAVYRFGTLLQASLRNTEDWDTTELSFISSLDRTHLEYLFSKILMSNDKQWSFYKMNLLMLCLEALGGISYFCEAKMCSDFMKVLYSAP